MLQIDLEERRKGEVPAGRGDDNPFGGGELFCEVKHRVGELARLHQSLALFERRPVVTGERKLCKPQLRDGPVRLLLRGLIQKMARKAQRP